MENIPSPSTALSDGAIIAASRAQPALFSTVFDRHFASIHRYLARRAGAQVADDLASSTFVVALERLASFHPTADDARPWLYGIATNLLRNHLRDERRRTEAATAMHANGTPPADGAGGGGLASPWHDASPVGEALASLDTDQREVLLLYAWGELSYEEIAASLSIPMGTVRSRLARARAQLRTALDPQPAGPALTVPTTDKEEP